MRAVIFLLAAMIASVAQALNLSELPDASFAAKSQWIETLAAEPSAETETILIWLLEGDLYYYQEQNMLVRAKRDGRNLVLTAIDGSDLGQVGRRDAKKIRVNNSLRSQIKRSIDLLGLADADVAIRSDAIMRLYGNLSYEDNAVLKTRLNVESNASLRDHLVVLDAHSTLLGNNPNEHLYALARLEGDLSTATVDSLSRFLLRDNLDTEVRAQAEELRSDIDSDLQIWGMSQNLFFGLSLGSVLLLAAIGLAITFGVMGVINMAHGELIMIGAYTTFVVQQLMPSAINQSLWVAIPAAFIVAGTMGIVLERTIIRHLYGRPLETLLATFGVSLILQQAVRSIFGPLNQSVVTPDWLSGAWEVNAALTLTYNRIFVIVFALVVLAGLWLLIKRTAFGMRIRAVTLHRPMASSMGISTSRMDALAFGLGSGVAGLAGVGLSQLTNVGPNLGQAYIIDSFLVVVFGGVASLMGTVVSAFGLGIANKLMEPWTGAVLAKIFVLVAVIIFIQKKPRGLFALKGRAVED